MKIKKLKTLFKMVEDANKVSSLCGDSEHAYRIYGEITFFDLDSNDNNNIYLHIENSALEGHRTSFFTWKQFVKTIDEDFGIEVYNGISNDLEEPAEGMSVDYLIHGKGFILAISVIGTIGYLKYDHN